MSAIASFYLLDTSKIDDLVQNAEIVVKKSVFNKKITDNYWEYLATNAQALKEFDASGYIYANLFVFLDEQKGIDLSGNEYENIAADLTEKRDSTHFFMTYKQRLAYADMLDPKNYSLSEIREFNKEFSDDDDEETAEYTLKALEILQDNLNQLEHDNQVLLLIVG